MKFFTKRETKKTMSHIKEYEVSIRDLEALALAAPNFGMELCRDVKQCHFYAGQKAPCDHVLRVKGNAEAYEVGLTRKADGSYALNFDAYNGATRGGVSVMQLIGGEQWKNNPTENLMNWYSASVAAKHYRAKGYACLLVKTSNGVQVRARK